MICELATVTLRGGAEMALRMFEPPEEAEARRLIYFLRHKDDDSMRGIRQRVLGQYADHCVDRYFVGEVEGRMVGHAWYGLPRVDPTEPAAWRIGNFGHVYTDPDWRGQGIAGEITRVIVDHFLAEPGSTCVLCSASEQSGRIYRRYGFQFIPPEASSGAMGLINPQAAGSFAELDAAYFAPGQQVRVLPGHIGHRHDLDRMLDFSAAWIEARRSWHFVGLASRVPTFISALHAVEDGRGLLTVLRTAAGATVGYAFVLALGARAETGLRVLDFVLHPHYLCEAPLLLGKTIALAREATDLPLYAAAAECDRQKVAALRQAGLTEQYRYRQAFVVDGQSHDVLVLASAG